MKDLLEQQLWLARWHFGIENHQVLSLRISMVWSKKLRTLSLRPESKLVPNFSQTRVEKSASPLLIKSLFISCLFYRWYLTQTTRSRAIAITRRSDSIIRKSIMSLREISTSSFRVYSLLDNGQWSTLFKGAMVTSLRSMCDFLYSPAAL